MSDERTADAKDELARLKARVTALEKALRPFALFAERFDARPIRGIADDVYSIHSGDDALEASLRLSDCRKARKALVGE